MAKKMTQAQLAARKRRGAKATKQAEEVIVKRFDELLAKLDAFEALTKARDKAQIKLMETIEKLVTARGSEAVDLTPLNEVLQRLEVLGGPRETPDYVFTFKHNSSGRYKEIHAKAVRPTKH